VNILNFFKRGSNKQLLSEMVLVDTTNRVYLKRLALNICVNYIARSISNSEFRVMDNSKVMRDTLHYKLNVRPNTDSSAADFWQHIIQRLIIDNEVLIIKTDTDDLVVADDFERVESALYDDIFRHVVVKDYEYNRNFTMSEVVYMTYNNERLSSFVDDLYKDYGRLFGQMMDNSMRANQLRGYYRFKDGGNLSKEAFERQKAQVEQLSKIFEDKSVAYAPLTEGIEFEDLTPSNTNKDESVKDLVGIKRDLTSDVAKMLGIPVNLIHGDVADIEKSIDAYITFCIEPLMKKIADELNAKFFTQAEYLGGKRVKIIGINKMNPLKHAEAADKLIASRTYSPNDIREMFGDERKDDPEMERHVMTKNYEHVEDSEGGENNSESEEPTE